MEIPKNGLGGEHCLSNPSSARNGILTIRSYSGLSGDMLCCGLGSIWLERQNFSPTSFESQSVLNEAAQKILPIFADRIKIVPRMVNGITGLQMNVDLPHCHEHRAPKDIIKIIEESNINNEAKDIAIHCVRCLARCEGKVHGIKETQVHFHEVGALDSILDICLASTFFIELGSPQIICSPLPLADGEISCAHGILPAPAPAVLAMLPGMRVKPFSLENVGELVTPTAIALLNSFSVEFGPWPEFYIEHTALVYGCKKFENVPNGVIFAYGLSF